MARRNPRRTGKKIPPRTKPKEADGDVGTDTSADTSHVNAPDSDKAIYKDPLKGKRLGKCHVKALIGEGKTAVVYKAIYTPLKRTVAVKVLQEHMTKLPAVVKVFEQEGRAVAALDHENILKIFDVGEEKGKHYLVLELLRGSDLLKVLGEADSGQLPVEDALDYVRQAAAGLAAAHRKNLVHRDIKPQNLVLEPDGTLKIVDFGLAAEAEGAYSGGRIGTPHYMSPEQCRGEAAETASDIYALGITLFHLLVGHPPFSGLHSTEEIVDQHLKPHRFEPEKIVRGIPRPVGDLVRKMTRHDPKTRPSAKEVYETIAKLTPEKLSAGPKRRGGAARHAAHRGGDGAPPTALYVGIGVVVIAVILFLVLGRGGEEPQPITPKKPESAKAPEKPAEEEKKPDVKVTGQLKSDVDRLLAEAKHEERTGNVPEAYRLYMRVVAKAPSGSAQYREAAAAAKILVDQFGEQKEAEDGKKRVKKVYVTVKRSEEAGQEIAERRDEFRDLFKRFEIEKARTALEALLARTRIETPERRAIELELHRLEFVERLLQLIESRTETLTGNRAAWVNYDLMASGDLIVISAGARGIELRDESVGEDETRSWDQVGPGLGISFIEGLRNKSSPYEALWMGYFCQLWDDSRAEKYFEFARMLDGSPEMKREIDALKADSEG